MSHFSTGNLHSPVSAVWEVGRVSGVMLTVLNVLQAMFTFPKKFPFVAEVEVKMRDLEISLPHS